MESAVLCWEPGQCLQAGGALGLLRAALHKGGGRGKALLERRSSSSGGGGSLLTFASFSRDLSLVLRESGWLGKVCLAGLNVSSGPCAQLMVRVQL